MWHADGSVHAAFHGFTRLLSSCHVDFVFMNELRTPLSLLTSLTLSLVWLAPSGGMQVSLFIKIQTSTQSLAFLIEATLFGGLLALTGIVLQLQWPRSGLHMLVVRMKRDQVSGHICMSVFLLLKLDSRSHPC